MAIKFEEITNKRTPLTVDEYLKLISMGGNDGVPVRQALDLANELLRMSQPVEQSNATVSFDENEVIVKIDDVTITLPRKRDNG